MRDQPDGSERYGPRTLFAPRNIGRGAGIALVVAGIAGAFAYTGGWLTPQRLTPARLVDALQAANGPHPGFRRNHPKGVCFTGSFESSGAGTEISKAELFHSGRTPVFGRFAIASGQPYLADTPTAIRSMALNFALRNGETWRMAINGMPVFPLRTTQDFYDQIEASVPDPRTGKPDPARLAAFVAGHPDTARALGIIKAQPPASGFADTAYNSLNAFLFINGDGRVTPVRWSMVPEDPIQPAATDAKQARAPNYQFDDLAARMRQGPVRWRFVATVGGPGDRTEDPTTMWPGDRRRIELGVLTVNRLQDEAHGACRDVTFDPLILPAGVKPSDDPILSARSAAYARSLTRRAGEPVPAAPVPVTQGSAR